jgi:hypothetical protein
VADYWDYSPTGHQGVIVLRSDTITGYTQYFTARIIANTALAQGGTSTLTIDSPAPATAYNGYQIYGTAGGASYVYRRYAVTNAAVAAQMTNHFPYPVAYRNSDGTAATLTSYPAGTVFYSQSGSAPYEQSSIGIECDAESGTILTARPTALVFSADGVTATPINDFQAFVPVNTGALEVRSPTTGYQGTAFSQLGIERMKVITCLDWKDSSNTLNMTAFASEYLATVEDIVYEGSLRYFGLLAAALLIGHKLNITGLTYPTGWDSFAIPIIGIDLEYCERSGATSYITTVTFSNRRAPYSGAALQRPGVLGQPFGIGQTQLRASAPPTVPSAAGRWGPAAAPSDQPGATDSDSGASPALAAALGGGPAPSDALAGSLPGGPQVSATDALVGQSDSPAAPLSGGAASSPKTGLADQVGRQRARQRLAEGRTVRFSRKPPSFPPRLADTFARSHSGPDVDSVSESGDDADPMTFTGQDDGTDTSRANPMTNSSKGSPNDQRVDRVSGTFDGSMGGSAAAVRAARLQEIPDSVSRPRDADVRSRETNQASGTSTIRVGTGDSHPSRRASDKPIKAVAPSKLEGRYWEGVGQVFRGYGDAVVGTAKCAAFMARHPIQTLQGIGTAIRHPIATGQAIGQMIGEKSGTLRGQGELVGDVLIGVATGGAVKAVSKTAVVAKIASKLKRVAGAAEAAAEGADAAGSAEAAAAEVVEAPAIPPQQSLPAPAAQQSLPAPAAQQSLPAASSAATGSGRTVHYHARQHYGGAQTVRARAQTGRVVLDDALNASAPGVRDRVLLNDRIVAPGQWKDGNIVLSRSAIRAVADETGDSVRRVLYDTAYHESFHGAIEPVAKRVSKWLGVDDIYDASYQAMLRGEGRGLWYRAEEGAAELHGRLRGFLRDRWGWR